MEIRVKNSSVKINNPAAKQRKLSITVNFVGGVHAIQYHYVLKINFVIRKKYNEYKYLI